MPSAIVFAYQRLTEQLTINVGLLIVIGGLLGNLLNIVIFTSLKTFRETTCAIYLTAASCANILHLLASLLSRILITGYNIDLTQTSTHLCKLRQFIAVIAPLVAVSSMCLATIDQYVSLTLRWRWLSQHRVAARLIMIMVPFWCLCSIPVLVYHNLVYSPATGQWNCAITNAQFSLYFSRVHVPVLLGFLQILVRVVFGLLAFVNVRRFARHRLPIIRRERDKQITSMVLIETVVDVLLSAPFVVYYTYTTNASMTDSATLSLYQLLIMITTLLNYSTFAVG